MLSFPCFLRKKSKQTTELVNHLNINDSSHNLQNAVAVNQEAKRFFFHCFSPIKCSSITSLFSTKGGEPTSQYNYKDNNNSNESIDRTLNDISDVLINEQLDTESLTEKLFRLSKFGWYWGPLTRTETDEKLREAADGAFLVRDSSTEKYVLTLSFRSHRQTFHTHIDHIGGKFSLQSGPEFSTVEELIEHSINRSLLSESAYMMYNPVNNNLIMYVKLTIPISRFTKVKNLQDLCRFVIRQSIRADFIPQLPLPQIILDYILEGQF